VVRIGFVAPLSGEDADAAREMRRAVELAIEEANHTAEVEEAGLEFAVASFDDEGDPDLAVAAAEALAADEDVACVVGLFGRGCTLAAASTYERAGLPYISVCSDPRVAERPGGVAHAVFPSLDSQAPVAAELVREDLGIGHVVVMDDGGWYGQTLSEAFRDAFESLGGAVDFASSTDTSPALVASRAQEAAPGESRALYYAGELASAPRAIEVREALGDGVAIVGSDTLRGSEYLTMAENLAGEGSAEGDVCTDLGLPPELQPRGADFQVAYAARWGESPGVHSPYAYDAAWMVVRAVRDAGLDRAAIERELDEMEFDGVTGTIDFNEVGATANQVVSVYRVVDDDWVLVQE
jgi:branched-chain amino acid transport system substrate-binding protein